MAKLKDFVKIQGKEVDLIIQEVALMKQEKVSNPHFLYTINGRNKGYTKGRV